MDKSHQLVWCLQLLGCFVQLVFAHRYQAAYLALYQSHVAHCLHHIACAWLAFGTDHGGAFGNASQGLSQVFGTAYEGHVELGLVDVVDIVGRRQHLALVDVVDFDSLQYLCFGNVSDAAFCHDGNGDGLLYAAYHLGVAHARDAASCTYVGWDALKSHYCTSSCLFGNTGLFGSSHVHDNTALQHLSQLAV